MNTDKYKVEDEAEQNNFKYCGHICEILGSRHETVDICWQVERRGQKTVSFQSGFGWIVFSTPITLHILG